MGSKQQTPKSVYSKIIMYDEILRLNTLETSSYYGRKIIFCWLTRLNIWDDLVFDCRSTGAAHSAGEIF